jgi:hypothetical protein
MHPLCRPFHWFRRKKSSATEISSLLPPTPTMRAWDAVDYLRGRRLQETSLAYSFSPTGKVPTQDHISTHQIGWETSDAAKERRLAPRLV